MRKYIGTVAVVALAALLVGGPLQGNQGKSDKDKFQGTWHVISMEREGEKASEDVIKKANFTMTVSGNKVTFKSAFDKKPEEGTVVIDASKSPRTITMTPTKESKDQKVMKGIYKFDGDDTLTICGNDAGEAPKEFKTAKGSKAVLLTLKREKK